MRGAVHRILCIPRKLLETCRLRVRFCPAGIGRRLQRGGKQQKRRLAKSLTAHDCRDRHNSIGADYAESVHNSGATKQPTRAIGLLPRESPSNPCSHLSDVAHAFFRAVSPFLATYILGEIDVVDTSSQWRGQSSPKQPFARNRAPPSRPRVQPGSQTAIPKPARTL